MKIDAAEVNRIAALAQLALTDAEVALLVSQLDAILGYVEKLDELDTTDVEPTAHAFPVTQPLRDDVPSPGLSVDEALGNAPDRDESSFVVPRVV